MRERKITSGLEDYLEAVFRIFEEKKVVRAIEISRLLGVGRSSVTDALKKLAALGYINYENYGSISLNEIGRQKAIEILTKHKFLSDFFKTTLNVDENESEKNACQIEHAISQEVFEKLSKYINFNRNFEKQNPVYAENLKKCLNED